MSRIGLALSGGGFRATLFHLGVLRFLHDARLLPGISHITSVSGGSIAAAHLVLNWKRYTGSDQDFEEAAGELLDFIRLDVRNRVVRRFPLAAIANGARFLSGRGRSRRLTRPGLLEAEYEKHLYGDVCLYELPPMPQLHILATNVNEGCLCSFTRSGLLLQRRKPEGGTRFELLPTTLATVPMAVTASSAFPGFFPPMQLMADDVGLEEGQFPSQLFTDGGVYDNLGVRMFRHLENSWIGYATPLGAEDFVDLPAACATLATARAADGNPPLRSLARQITPWPCGSETAPQPISAADLPAKLWNVILHKELYADPAFASLDLGSDEEGANLLGLARRGRELDIGDRLFLNRRLIQAAFATAGKGELLHAVQTDFDGVIVSDAAKQFAVSRRTRSVGLLGLALRTSDILMNRVWQLESDQFHTEPDFLFAPMSMTVPLADDANALHPEIQQQVTNTRTDLDRFSDMEISGLIRHGYAVTRQVCRRRPDLFGEELPGGPPWDPTSPEAPLKAPSATLPSPVTQAARRLQSSSERQILGNLLSLRDWPTYVYLPLLLALLVVAPFYGYRAYQRARRSEMIVDAITFSNPDFQLVLQLARQNPLPGDWTPLEAEEVAALDPARYDGFQMVTDTRVFDMRAWQPGVADSTNRIITYRRMRVRRDGGAEMGEDASPVVANKFRLQQFAPTGDASVRCEAQDLRPVLRAAPQVGPSGQDGFLYELELDLASVPRKEHVDIGFEVSSSRVQGRADVEQQLVFPIVAPTDVAMLWVMLPTGRPYDRFLVIARDPRVPASVQSIEPTYDFQMADGSLFGWMLVAPLDGHTYECRWTYRE
jgi:predicted acylesterase/phospholipase RssA